jgi:predicted DNA-binding transcriptional regulator YafY
MSHNAGVADTSARMLRLLSLLQARRWWPGAELAGRLGVSARTLRRDVGRLRELGYPVRARRGTGGGYELAAGAALPPLGLDEEEAVALTVGLQDAAVAGIAGTSARALAKLAPALPGPLRRQVGALAAMTVPAAWGGDGEPGPAPGAAALLAAAQACREAARVAFGYTARGGARTDREVEPHWLVLLAHRALRVPAGAVDGADGERGHGLPFLCLSSRGRAGPAGPIVGRVAVRSWPQLSAA